MNKLFLLSGIWLLSLTAFGQDRYMIFFTDKNNSPFSISQPLDFLSQKAIDRRTNQNINLDDSDLPVNPAYVTGVASTGATVLNRTKWFNAVSVWATSQQLTQIQQLPYVASTLDVGRISATGKNKFSQETYRTIKPGELPEGKSSSFNYGSSFNQVSMLKGHTMHDNGYTGTGLVIAVLDAGFLNVDIMACFDSLRNSGRLLSTFDFVDPGSSVYNDDSHGAMVLSAMASILPGDMIGTAPHASYHLLRSEDAPSENIIEEYNWASAGEYADSAGADIINSSLGYTEFDDPTQDHTYADMDGNTTPVTIAADMAASKGIIVVNSAGNQGTNAWFHISAPSDGDSVMAAAAVDAASAYVSFSGKGPSADGRIKPNVAAQGEQTVLVEPWSGTGVNTMTGNGTSFSSPLLAGMMACLWQCHPNATNMQLISAVQQSATQANNPDSLLGYGIPDFTLACLILGGIDPGIANNGDNLIVEGNPFSDVLSFSVYTNNTQDATIRVIDLLGQTIYESSATLQGITMNKFSINLHPAKGVYMLEVKGENSLMKQKVISR